uniref:Malectin-like domain-containing protein n=1 Tax=Leersia perrieri TaxID=77586 RepID=A0A0D9XCN9_9ORYZ
MASTTTVGLHLHARILLFSVLYITTCHAANYTRPAVGCHRADLSISSVDRGFVSDRHEEEEDTMLLLLGPSPRRPRHRVVYGERTRPIDQGGNYTVHIVVIAERPYLDVNFAFDPPAVYNISSSANQSSNYQFTATTGVFRPVIIHNDGQNAASESGGRIVTDSDLAHEGCCSPSRFRQLRHLFAHSLPAATSSRGHRIWPPQWQWSGKGKGRGRGDFSRYISDPLDSTSMRLGATGFVRVWRWINDGSNLHPRRRRTHLDRGDGLLLL